MDLSPYVESLRRDLTTAAAAGADETRRVAELLANALEPATRLALLEALTDAAAEVTAALDGPTVDVRMHGREPRIVVTPGEPADHAGPAAAGDAWFPGPGYGPGGGPGGGPRGGAGGGPRGGPRGGAGGGPGGGAGGGPGGSPGDGAGSPGGGAGGGTSGGAGGPGEDPEGTARITLRMPESVKARVEETAAREALSVNTWLVRTVARALDPAPNPRGGRRITGYARG